MSHIASVGRMTPRDLFVVTAVMEVGAGLALIAAPALLLRLLFGPSESQAGVAIGRLAGASLLSLGAACWWSRHDGVSAAARGLVSGLLIYNAAVVALVLSASFGSIGPLLLTVVVVHGAMGLWCTWSLWAGR
jgi:hypothetical protein